MSELNKAYCIYLDVETMKFKRNHSKFVFFNTDNDTCTITLIIHRGEYNTGIVNHINNHKEYTCEANVLAPNGYGEVLIGKLANNKQALYVFDIPSTLIKLSGEYQIEFLIKHNNEVVTSYPTTYIVRKSIFTSLDETIGSEEEQSILQNLLERVSVLEASNGNESGGSEGGDEIIIDSIDASKVTYNDNEQYATVADALNKLLYVPISISSFTCNVNTVELGNTVNSCTFNWAYNKTIQSQTFNGQTLTSSIRSYTYSTSFNSNRTFILSATDGTNGVSRTLSINFYNRIYWGASNEGEVNSNFIRALGGNTLSNSINRTITVTANEGQYIYYAFPSRLGTPVFKVGGFEGGFEELENISFTNSYGYNETYSIYKSVNANLGQTTIEISS